jgi:hypothetical protein
MALLVGLAMILVGFPELINDNPHPIDSLILWGGCFGGAGIITLGIFTFCSGRMITLRRRRKFTLTIAALNAPFIPVGTILAILTFRLMRRQIVVEEYAA